MRCCTSTRCDKRHPNDHRGKRGEPGRTLTGEDIARHQRVVVAHKETMRLMGEIDEVIEEHGGWPIE